MIGCQDFIGFYDFTFEYLRSHFGEEAVQQFWLEAISQDSQRHAAELIIGQGFDGMDIYWGHTLEAEEAGYTFYRTPDCFREDMFACPSLGYLLEHGQHYYHDYCEHCLAWVKPIMDRAGFVIEHEHNHAGQCYWEMRRSEDAAQPNYPAEPPDIGANDVRRLPNWRQPLHHHTHKSERVE